MRLGIAGQLEHNSPEEWARRHHELGCRCVNFPMDYTGDEGIIDEYVAAAKKYDLVIAEVGVWCNPIAADAETREQAKIRCIEQLKLADKIGAKCCVNVSGTTGERWDGPYYENFTEEVWDMVVKSIQEIIDAVNPQNTYYTIEPMPWMIPMNPDQYLKLIADVDRERFAVHMDVVNWITSPEKYFLNTSFIEECFAKLGDRIKSCHLKDINCLEKYTWQVEEVMCGKGILNLEKYAELATKMNVDMPMVIEHLKSEEEYINSYNYVRERLK
ncbi:MAG: TIM barrel protein [Eubacteriales bacterium]